MAAVAHHLCENKNSNIQIIPATFKASAITAEFGKISSIAAVLVKCQAGCLNYRQRLFFKDRKRAKINKDK
jgi:hypothetical protein